MIGSVLNTLQVHAGYGRHLYCLSKQQIREAAKWTTLSEVQSLIGIYFVKVSVCFFIMRMLSRTNRAIQRTLVGFLTVLSILMVANVLLLCLRCIPIQGIWDHEVASRCILPSKIEKVSKAFSSKLSAVKRKTVSSIFESLWRDYRFHLRPPACIRRA